MSKLFLGIDGGGSKTEFVVADENLRIVKAVRLSKGTNPWSQGIDKTLAVLKEGLDQLVEYQGDIIQCVAGISGCFTPNEHAQRIASFLQQFYAHVRVIGDLPISFRAGTDQSAGIIAIAGSGSSVVHFYNDGSNYVYDGVAVGGRDLGFWLARAYERKTIHEEGRQFLESVAPVLREKSLRNTGEYYHNDQLRHIAEHIAGLEPDSPAFQSVRTWIDAAADRWQYKLYGIVQKFTQKEPDVSPIPVVLSGGLWQFEFFRESVVASVERDFGGRVHVVYSQVAPVVGALKIAREIAAERVTR